MLHSFVITGNSFRLHFRLQLVELIEEKLPIVQKIPNIELLLVPSVHGYRYGIPHLSSPLSITRFKLTITWYLPYYYHAIRIAVQLNQGMWTLNLTVRHSAVTSSELDIQP